MVGPIELSDRGEEQSPPRHSFGIDPTVSIVMPCLNEAATVGVCVNWAQEYLNRSGVPGEIIVADNGSSDASPQIARDNGAIVLHVPERGYGAALRAGIRTSRGVYIIMGDSDASYDFRDLDAFVEELSNGADIVVGNRYMGGIEQGAMPPLHRYLGNPVLSWLAKTVFGVPARDVYCGLRAFRRAAVEELGTTANGMEFALEMLVRARLRGLRITEVPTTLLKDQRVRASHLDAWEDGWRSLRLYLMFSPNWAFLYPGLLLLTLSAILGASLVVAPLKIGEIEFSVHTLVFCGFGTIIGFQAVAFAIFAQVTAIRLGLLEEQSWVKAVQSRIRPRNALIVGLSLTMLGVLLGSWSVYVWQQTSFSGLDPFTAMRIVVPAGTITALGIQLVMASFYMATLNVVVDRLVPDKAKLPQNKHKRTASSR